MGNENKDSSTIKYSIWNTRTKENLDITKEKITEALENTTPEADRGLKPQ